ncbi:hypothetical protein GGX14DRAFT_478988 [Mycena pura]|uniref:MYND-type domain-containing protein n=1 Tax=Mycena pura TaxID=153505 RepID=A0AAD6UUV6_9AGAR|nr:hypothetical protein GGX14DRAFT_478988 [Mycena pura]
MPRESLPKVTPGTTLVEVKQVTSGGFTHSHITTTDGNNQLSHQLSLPTKEERREQLDTLETTCIACEKTVKRTDIKVCSACKDARYCSKECQKAHWKVHKLSCGPGGSPIPLFVERALADGWISFHLAIGIVNLLGLMEDRMNARTAAVKLTWDLSVADTSEYMRRMFDLDFPPHNEGDSDEVKEARHQAFLALHFERCLILKKFERLPMEDAPEAIRALHEASKQEPNTTTVTLLLLAADGSFGENGTFRSISISEAVFDHIRRTNNKATVNSSLLGLSEANMTPEFIREHTNNQIRMDKGNKLKLRIKPQKI